jgi:serine/threonine protein kinase
LFFALTGEVPFRGKTKREILNQHLSAPVPDPRMYRKDIPETFVRIIQRAMAKNSGERYQDAAEMAIGLRNMANNLRQSKVAERWWGQFASTGSITPQENRKKKSSGTAVRSAVILVILVAIGGIIFWAVQTSGTTKTVQGPSTITPVPVIQTQGQQVPVKVIIGSPLYHAANCPRLKGVPADKIVNYPSEEEAITKGFLGCTLCQDDLKKQKEELRSGKTHQSTAPSK